MTVSALPTSRAPDDASPEADFSALARLPPQNVEAEQALLGAVFQSGRAYERVSDFLRAEHFSIPVHARIYEACGRLIDKGQIVNPLTLKTYLENDTLLQEAGGVQYLTELVNAAVTVINALDYGKLIHDLALRRELIDIGNTLVNDAFITDIDSKASDHIEVTEQKLYDLATTGEQSQGFQDFATALTSAIYMAEAAHRREGRLAGVPSGLIKLDEKLGGLHPSDLIILAGRPSMGKTALATSIAFNAARLHQERVSETGAREVLDGARVAFFSLEMSAEQLATRLLAQEAEISSHKIRTGELGRDDFSRMVRVSQTLHKVPLYIDDTPALSISAVRTRCRRLARQQGLGLVVIDYLQLLSANPGVRSENRVVEVSHITRGLKALAKELNVPVIALSQLSRAVENRDDKRPQLSDLRESGSIEQDADVVMFVYREQYYLERDKIPEEETDAHNTWKEKCERAHNKAEVIIAKQRHGPIGNIDLYFDSHHTKFANLHPHDGG